MDHKAKAEELLTYYMRRAIEGAGGRWNGDNQTEVEEIVHHIIKAAAQEAVQIVQAKLDRGPAE